VFENKQLTGVIIPASVTTLDDGSFKGNQLTGVIIPASVTTLDDGSFKGNQLTSVIFPDSVTSFGRESFQDNPLISITIGVIKDERWNEYDRYSYRNSANTFPANTNFWGYYDGPGTYTRPDVNSNVWTKQQ